MGFASKDLGTHSVQNCPVTFMLNETPDRYFTHLGKISDFSSVLFCSEYKNRGLKLNLSRVCNSGKQQNVDIFEGSRTVGFVSNANIKSFVQ